MSSLEVGDRQAAAVQKTPHRVTLDSLRAKMKTVQLVHPSAAPHMTIAVVELENGFIVVGKSAPADPANFDAKLGEQFAIGDCIRQMWALDGYLLRERLHEGRA